MIMVGPAPKGIAHVPILRIAVAVLLLSAPALRSETTTRFQLDNGLDVVVIEDHRAPVVVQMIWYRVGSADEVAGTSGIAHFLEHLMFKGTETTAPGEFSAVVEAQGGKDNAFTSWDYTAYFQRVAADRLDLMMQLEADRMRNLRLTEEDVTTERQVILEERAQRTETSPGALLSEQMRAAQYLNHPYGRPIIGWRHEMEQLSRDDALTHYNRYYAPDNATLVIAGDVAPDEVRRLAELYYGPLERSAGFVPRDRPQEPPQLAERRITLADDRVSEPNFTRTYLAPERDPGNQGEAAALTILAELLGGSGQTSVLARALQFDSQTAPRWTMAPSDLSWCRCPASRWRRPKRRWTRRWPGSWKPGRNRPPLTASRPRYGRPKSMPATMSKAWPGAMAKNCPSA
jgi:zinc protease